VTEQKKAPCCEEFEKWIKAIDNYIVLQAVRTGSKGYEGPKFKFCPWCGKKLENIFKTEVEWPDGISDGLVLPCSDCGKKTNFDYKVTDELWNRVVPVDKKHDVICLDCFDKRVKKRGMLLFPHLLEIQYTAKGETIILKPKMDFVYKSRETK